jgi:hypothetical protein
VGAVYEAVNELKGARTPRLGKAGCRDSQQAGAAGRFVQEINLLTTPPRRISLLAAAPPLLR